MDTYFRNDVGVSVAQAMMSDEMVARAAWVSSGVDYDETKNQGGDRIAGLIYFLMKNRHGTPFEHNSITFRVEAPIFVWREFMRHRIGISYNEESGRYKQLDPVFYIPREDRALRQVGKVGAYDFIPGTPEQIDMVQDLIKQNCHDAYERYLMMLEADVAKEVARMVLPVNIFSSAYVTMNARSIMAFLSLRTKHPDSAYPSFPQKEINMVADMIESVFESYMPITAAAFTKHGRVSP